MKHAVIALALAGLAAAALPAPADAHCRGCGVAAGVVGGVAVGALIGSALAGPRPVYVEEAPPPPPPRVYYYEEDGRGPVCRVERRRFWVEGYGWRTRRIETCD